MTINYFYTIVFTYDINGKPFTERTTFRTEDEMFTAAVKYDEYGYYLIDAYRETYAIENGKAHLVDLDHYSMGKLKTA